MATEVSSMISGLGMAMALIRSLSSEIKKAGGWEEQLHFLTTERGQEGLKKVAALIVSLEWRVPKSLVIELSRKKSMQDYPEGTYVETDGAFNWHDALDALNVPYIIFLAGGEYNSQHGTSTEKPLLPDELRKQLKGKKAVAGMFVEWEDQQYVVTRIGGHSMDLNVGDEIDDSEIEWLNIASVRYFDLNR